MLLNLQTDDFDKDIYPYIKKGIIIDTSVFRLIIDGLVCTRLTKENDPELYKITSFLDLLKMKNKWDKFLITPHILTEICTHLRNEYSKTPKYAEIVKEILPLLAEMEDKIVEKDDIIKLIDLDNPIVEVGDISIFVVADDFIKENIKIAILSNDHRLNGKYKDSRNVMVLDYQNNMLNQL